MPTPQPITWYRKQARTRFDNFPCPEGDCKPTLTIDSLGIVAVNGYPAYDNGSYYVVDTVLDLEWVVVSWEGHVQMKVFPLDKYEAIRHADDLKESDLRSIDG